MTPIENIMQYIPLFAVLGTIVLSVKFLSPVLITRQKQKQKANEPPKRKTLMESAEDFFGNAPTIYMQLENLIQEQRKAGATEDQLKPLLEKQKWVGRICDPMYGNVLQTVALGGIKYVKKLGLNL